MNDKPSDEFARLYLQNQGRVYAYIATLIPNRMDAEDLLQKTSLVMWRKWDIYDSSQSYIAWARGIALNEIRNFVRKKERKNIHLSESMIMTLSSKIELEEGKHATDRIEALEKCLDCMEDPQRDLVEQCYLESRGARVVADRLGISIDAVYMRLHRARRTLVNCIERRLSLRSSPQTGGVGQ